MAGGLSKNHLFWNQIKDSIYTNVMTSLSALEFGKDGIKSIFYSVTT